MNDLFPPQPYAAKFKRLELLTHILYGLYAFAFLTTGITAVIAIIINYIKFDDVRGTPYELHFRWQKRTFWFGLLWLGFGVVLMFFFIGYIILGITCIWLLYRLIKGWLYLYEGRSMIM